MSRTAVQLTISGEPQLRATEKHASRLTPLERQATKQKVSAKPKAIERQGASLRKAERREHAQQGDSARDELPSIPQSCEITEAPGYWGGPRNLDWTLHSTERCPVPLQRFVSVQPSSCGAKVGGKSGLPTNLPSCVVRE